jgi:NADH:ubiquinone oxidoreductase subunit K
MFSTPVLLLLSGLILFFIGIIQCVSSKSLLPFLFGIEIIINAANLNLISFLNIQPERIDIEPLILVIIGFAAIESAVGLSIFAWANRRLKLIGSPQIV